MKLLLGWILIMAGGFFATVQLPGAGGDGTFLGALLAGSRANGTSSLWVYVLWAYPMLVGLCMIWSEARKKR